MKTTTRCVILSFMGWHVVACWVSANRRVARYTFVLFIKLTRSGDRTCAQLVESFCDEHGKSRRRTVTTLGRIGERLDQVDSLLNGLPVASTGDLQVRFESALCLG